MTSPTTRGMAPGRLLLVLLTLIAGLSLYLAAGAQANTTIVVHSTADEAGEEECPGPDCTLREALELAQKQEGEVKIELAVEGTIELEDGELEFESNEPDELWIAGPGKEKLTIDAEGESRVFAIEEVANAKLTGVTVTGGSVGEFHHGGAGIYTDGVGTLTLEGDRIAGNTAAHNGGGIELEDGQYLEMFRTEVADNVTEEGEGGGVYSEVSFETKVMEGSSIEGNRASTNSGGGIATEDDLLIDSSTIADNLAAEKGGGIFTEQGVARTVEVVESKIDENIAQSGGGLYADGDNLSEVMIEGSEIDNNGATFGGGLWLEAKSRIEGTTLAHNANPDTGEAEGGAAVYVANGEPVLIRTSTIAENRGSAIYTEEELSTTIQNSTIAANESLIVRGAIHGQVSLASTIVAGNRSGEHNAFESDCSGEVASEGHNLLGEGVGGGGEGCEWFGNGEGDQFNADPELAPLGNYGGVNRTMPPQSSTSPAINHGSDPTKRDQRGKPRPVPVGPAFTDVGAVEVQAPLETSAPSIAPAANLVTGEELSCLSGGWNTDTVTNPTYSYAWNAGSEIVGSASKLTLTNADAGKPISCEVSVDDGATTTSVRTGTVELEPGLPLLSPSSLEFGARRLDHGATAPRQLTVGNGGGAGFAITSVTSSDPTEFAVAVDGCSGEEVPPSGGCEVSVTFDPAVEGDRSATITIVTSAGELIAEASGRGTLGDFDADPPAVAFGNRVVGTDSGWKAVTIGNGGTGSYKIGIPALEGSGAGAFELRPSGCEGKTLAPGKSCTIKVRFAPTATGATTATLSVPGERPGTVALSGTGTKAVFAAAPPSLAFGEVLIGESEPQTVKISDPGTAPATITGLAFEGAGATEFGLPAAGDGCTGTTLQPGEECSVTVEFDPVATGAAAATLSVEGDSPGTVPLSGTGVAPVFAIGPATHAFGAVQVGQKSAAQTFVVTDEGTGPMTLGTPHLEGPGASQFAIGALDTCSGATLAAGDHCTIDVYYAPSATGTAAATLEVPGTASGSASLQGEGTAPPVPSSQPSQPGTTPPTPGPAPATEPAAHLKLPASGIEVGDKGTASIGLVCPAGNSACPTTLELLSGGAKGRKLARWKGTVAAGSSRTVKLHLPRSAREKLDRDGKLTIIVVLTDGHGGKTRQRLILKRGGWGT